MKTVLNLEMSYSNTLPSLVVDPGTLATLYVLDVCLQSLCSVILALSKMKGLNCLSPRGMLGSWSLLVNCPPVVMIMTEQ